MNRKARDFKARSFKERTRKSKTPGRRHFSIAFLIAIPGNFILGTIGLLSLYTLLSRLGANSERWVVFATGFAAGLTIVGGTKMSTFRVFIHELKHAIMVTCTGNSIKHFKVGSETGHVEFEMYADKLHFAPIIALAPYFFPLFSLPVLAAAVVLEGYADPIFVLALGFFLAADLSFAYTDLHPHQTDLQHVTGGTWMALLYLAATHFLWWMICLLWVAGGRSAFIYAGYTAARLGAELTLKHFK